MTCRICGSGELQMVLDLGSQPWGNDFRREPNEAERFPLELYFCHDCSLVQLGYTVPKEKMFLNHSYISGTTRTLRAHFDALAKSVVNEFWLELSDLVVDIGGNDGSQLQGYKDHGLRVLNIESGTQQAAQSMYKGIPVIQAFFNERVAIDVLAQHGKAQIINAAGVFFHLEELHSVVRGIKKLLAEDGVFVVQFIYLADIIAQSSFDNIYHEHLLYYTVRSLQNLLSMYGLEIFDCYRSEIHGGSMIGYVGHAGARPVKKAVREQMERELAEQLDQVETYQRFAQRAATVKADLLALLDKSRNAGKTIYAYGAPVKGSTLLNYCGLDTRYLACAVEKNPFKCMRYYPGTDIPVIDEALARRPDQYLVLAWNFLREFVVKERQFLADGGEFIVPVPSPRILDWRAPA